MTGTNDTREVVHQVLTWIGFPYYHRTTSEDLDRSDVPCLSTYDQNTCFLDRMSHRMSHYLFGTRLVPITT